MAVFDSLTFDNVNSLDYGVYITGAGVYDMPERDVELIEVPGRNGDIIIDHGRYKNILVKYTAGCIEDDGESFAEKMAKFRAALASRKGYNTLTDTYNPDEKREGAFLDAISVEPAGHNTAGEFDLIFNCKPQRFLLSGDEDIEAASGAPFENITLFDASPLILAEGYGTINLNGHEIEIVNETIGRVALFPEGARNYEYFDGSLLNPGDIMHISQIDFISTFQNLPSGASVAVTDITRPAPSSEGGANVNIVNTGPNIILRMTKLSVALEYGTPSNQEAEWTVNVAYTNNGTTTNHTVKLTLSVLYGGGDQVIFRAARNTGTFPSSMLRTMQYKYTECWSNSSVTTLGHPTYIDCDMGEVYKIEGGRFIALNRLTDLGSKLPTLKPGNNALSFDNTFSSVKIRPRWWTL